MNFIVNNNSWPLKFDNFSYFQNVINNKSHIKSVYQTTMFFGFMTKNKIKFILKQYRKYDWIKAWNTLFNF